MSLLVRILFSLLFVSWRFPSLPASSRHDRLTPACAAGFGFLVGVLVGHYSSGFSSCFFSPAPYHFIGAGGIGPGRSIGVISRSIFCAASGGFASRCFQDFLPGHFALPFFTSHISDSPHMPARARPVIAPASVASPSPASSTR